MTYGGYSKRIVVDEKFVLRVPANLTLPGAAPLLCAGITTYSPLRHWKVEPRARRSASSASAGSGHMGVKFAHAMGAHVVLFTTSPGKAADARRLGADDVVISRNPDEMKTPRRQLRFHPRHGLGPARPGRAHLRCSSATARCAWWARRRSRIRLPASFNLIFKRRQIAGSLIGGIRETQEMLDFCAAHGITSDVEMIRMQEINVAYERMLKSDVKYRFVIDMASLG